MWKAEKHKSCSLVLDVFLDLCVNKQKIQDALKSLMVGPIIPSYILSRLLFLSTDTAVYLDLKLFIVSV